MSFWVFRCKFCGCWGVRELRRFNIVIHKALFNCKYCDKIMKIKKEGSIGLSLNNRGPYDCNKAAIACKILNDKGGIYQDV